jgi:hypothetical protein
MARREKGTRSTEAALHAGQLGVLLPETSSSNWFAQLLQTYSYKGIATLLFSLVSRAEHTRWSVP